MAQQLNAIGIWVKRRIAVGDDKKEIQQALDEALSDADIVLITGGLGPTADDITKPLLCEYFGGKMITDEKVLQHVTHIFQHILKRTLLERNLKQAEVPDNCRVLMNQKGTAPGMWFEKKGENGTNKIIVSLPGVPHEMKGIVTEKVLPLLQTKQKTSTIIHRTLLTAGAGESFIAERLQNWETDLPETIKLAYLPNYGMVRLRLTGRDRIDSDIERLTEKKFEELQDLVSDLLVIAADAMPEKALGDLLLAKNKTIATAESCTGGYIAHLFTSMAGASGFYKGSVIAYDNSIKTGLLNVSKNLLETKGAVSEETVTAMLNGLLEQTGADYGIAVSGIMGPRGGSEEKPVGTVWVAAGSAQQHVTKSFHFRFDRQRNIQLTAVQAVLLLLQFIRSEP